MNARSVKSSLPQFGRPRPVLTDEAQLAFSQTIGEVVPPGDEGVSKISFDPTVSSTADYICGVFFRHIDGANDIVPARATMLIAKTLSDEDSNMLLCCFRD